MTEKAGRDSRLAGRQRGASRKALVALACLTYSLQPVFPTPLGVNVIA